jgi:serine/threonine protein kinase/tetratricopeptide (TPR) repeat protein
MSRVYLARESLPERDVAIKVLDEELSARLGRERFVREVEVTSQLQHPHIVPIYAAGDAGGTLYYVMPYISGESLRDRLVKEGRLPIQESLKITHQVADALEHAHRKEIVHRDIKPSNILFQSGHAVVADFGIARALRAAESGGEFTQSGLPIGTPDYMSPEQAGGDDPIDGRTDTYSLACVLYEMLAGQPPFHSRTAQATLARHLTDTMPSLRSVRSSVPRALEQVIAQALAKSPADRPRAVSHFADALLVANRSGALRVDRESGQRPRMPMASRVAAGLALIATIGLAIQFWSASASANGPYESSVAVTPFENRTGDESFDLLGLSIAEEVITRLTTVPEVFVSDMYSAASAMNDSVGTRTLLESLDVEHVLRGYIERRGDELVVNVSESNAEGFLHARTQYFVDPDNRARDQVVVANEVARAFLESVGLDDRYDPGGSVIGPGRDAYLAGNAALGQRTPEGMREAVTWFREAIELEPRSAAALSALSSTYALSLYYKYDVGLTPYELAARSLAAADQAISADPRVANGYSARGYIRALLGLDLEGAAADFEQAEALAPNAPNGPSWSARILAGQNRIDEAFAEAERARDLDPLQAGRRTALASLGFQLGRYAVTINEAREAYRLEDKLLLAKAFEGRALAMVGEPDECLAIDFGVYNLVRALCLYADGQSEEARRIVEDAERQLETSGSPSPDYTAELIAQDLASYYGMTGDPSSATRWLRFAFDLSPAGVDTRILGSALFDPVRDAPEFADAVDDVQRNAHERVIDMRMSLSGSL